MRSPRCLLKRLCVLCFVLGLILGHAGLGFAQQLDATWLGGTGDWNNVSLWSTPAVPNNNGTSYRVFIDGGLTGTSSVVTVTSSPTIDSLTIDAGDTLRQFNHLIVEGGSILNDGSILLNPSMGGSSFDHTLRIDGDAALTGTGTARLSTARIRAVNVGDTLTQGSQHSIRGFGYVGAGALNLINDGNIIADVDGAALVIDVANQGVNNGLMSAVGGATLTLETGLIDNTNGIIRAEDNSRVVFRNGAQLKNGLLETSGNGFMEITGSTLLTEGTVTNNGVIKMNPTATNPQRASIRIVGDTTFTGDGMIEMRTRNEIQAATAGDTLTNGIEHTISGSGLIREGINLINYGNIIANIDGGALAVDVANQVVNNGVMAAVGSATLRLDSGLVDNTDGVIRADDNARVVFGSGAQLKNGLLETRANGFMEITGATALMEGTITNNGVIKMNPNAVNAKSFLGIVGDTTITGNGSLEMTSSNQTEVFAAAAGDTLTNGSLHTIRGSGLIRGGINLINDGIIEANNANNGGLTLDPDYSIVNNGTVRATNGATLRVLGTTFGGPGTVEALDGSTVLFDYGSADVLENRNASTLASGTWRAIDQGNGATIHVTNGSAILAIGENADVALSGPGASIIFGPAPISQSLQVNRGTLALLNGAEIQNAFTNEGRMIMSNGQVTIAADEVFVQEAGGVTEGTGIISLSNSNAKFLDNGTISPGFSPGMLTIDGGVYEQTETGLLMIELAGILPGTEYDQLRITGQAILGGSLSVSLLDDFVPQSTDNFTILTADLGITGRFLNAYSRLLFADGSFDVFYIENSVILSNFSNAINSVVPVPSTLVGLFSMGLVVLASRTWRRRLHTSR